MIFSGEFDDTKEIDIFNYIFPVEEAISLNLMIHEGPFEHVLIVLKDPVNEVRGMLTFKTRIKSHFVGSNLEHTTNGLIPGVIQKGNWTLTIIKPSKLAKGKFQVELTTAQEIRQLNANRLFPVLNVPRTEGNRYSSPHWLTGELHTHSYFSDGRVSFYDMKETFEAN